VFFLKKWITSSIAAISFFLLLGSAASAQHYVKKGETLWQISKNYNMPYHDILELNPNITNPNLIYPNQYITVRNKGTKADQIVDYAKSLEDVTQYVYGAKDFSKTPYLADCSSWTQHIYREFGIVLPRVSWEQARIGENVTFKELQKGDLMFFGDNGKISHVGIYMGDNKWISNLGTGQDVVVLSTYGTWSHSAFLYGTRVI
jgi:cell wall-associated NlpC family hydrolase